jgi:hypothetical protein
VVTSGRWRIDVGLPALVEQRWPELAQRLVAALAAAPAAAQRPAPAETEG